MDTLEDLDKNNLHHAYLLEGAREEILPEILKFITSLGVEKNSNPDFYQIELDSFKVEDARNIKSYAAEKGSSTGLPAQAGKKIFIIRANNFLLEAQNSLLKILEEPAEGTHFFIIVPDINALLPTFISRFHLIRIRQDPGLKEAEKFISLPLAKRIDFIKELLAEEEGDEDEVVILDSARSRSLKFLNALESVLHDKEISNLMENSERRKSDPVIREGSRRQNFSTDYFHQLFQVRKYLRQPGSSAKSLMESVALVIPDF